MARNSSLVPEAKAGLERMKYEVASSLVKRMISQAKGSK